ncbi:MULTISPECIES: hypothetical protein [unclassified Rhizobium]|uniref:hypothetical protein n=1 Tax=unclassified Rhizobium TaxID=2613769 RepID=UPI0017868182|nr:MULTISPECIES: hypothetical protein [unclassified Rhizobium]MBD8689596.1 hypothetical protein [Rhizobium sp. CFBP 13644]MBD8694203.1 hypothetical protein [Rhizobium sp. CFBP 13717]
MARTKQTVRYVSLSVYAYSNQSKRVYHVKNLTAVLRKRSGNTVLEALKTIRRHRRHPLVLHLSSEEPQPSKAWLKQFNCVVDESDLDAARSTFRAFVHDHQQSAVWCEEAEDDCKLVFDTLRGSQQFTELFFEAREVAAHLIGEKTGLILEEKADYPQQRTLCVRMKSWRELHASKRWKGYSSIWVRGDHCKDSGPGYGSLCLADQSMENLAQLAKKIEEGRPWMARRTRPTKN